MGDVGLGGARGSAGFPREGRTSLTAGVAAILAPGGTRDVAELPVEARGPIIPAGAVAVALECSPRLGCGLAKSPRVATASGVPAAVFFS